MIIKRLTLITLVITTLAAGFWQEPAAQAQPASVPRPHLGYGIHVAPYAGGATAAEQLNMDWVKVYEPFQLSQFATKNTLYRMDLPWPSNWEQFKLDVRNRTRDVVNLGADAIEVHNEPNLRIEWHSVPNAWEYTQMLRVAYIEIKAVAPQVTVVSAGLAPAPTTGDGRAISDLEFARDMFENGAGDYFDVFGYHPYGFNAPPEDAPAADKLNFRRVELIRQLMVRYNLGHKPIWLTEFGWLRNPAEDGVGCGLGDPDFREFAWMQVDGQTQADYIVRAFDYADRNWAYVGPMFLWNLNWSMFSLTTLSRCNHMRWFSLLKADGQATTAFYTVAAMTRRPLLPIPEMTLEADAMTVEVGVNCPGVVKVGEFEIQNTGYPGTFTATISPAVSLSGPQVDVTPTTARDGDTVTVYADTTGLDTSMYIIFINVTAEIAGRNVARNVRGYVIVSDNYAACN